MAALPLVGRTRVVSTPMVVVFPAPFGPSSPKTSAGATVNETPSTALTGDFGYRLIRSATATAGSGSLVAMIGMFVVSSMSDPPARRPLLANPLHSAGAVKRIRGTPRATVPRSVGCAATSRGRVLQEAS